MEDLRRRLLEAAKEFYTKFTQMRADDPSLKAELGRSYFRLGQITGEIDSPSKAIALEEKARDILSEVGAEGRADLAKTYHHLGRLNRLAENTPAAETNYKKALDLWPALVKADDKYQDDLARTHIGLGNINLALRRLDATQQAYDQSRPLLTPLVAKHPDNMQFQRDLAVTLANLATARTHAGRGQRSNPGDGRQRQQTYQRIVSDKPDRVDYRNDLARSHFFLGAYYLSPEMKDTEKARDKYKQAAAEWEELSKRHPKVRVFRSNLASAYLQVAELGGVEATKYCAKAVSLQQQLAAEDKSTPDHTRGLALAQLRLGIAHQQANEFGPAANALRESLTLVQQLIKQGNNLPHYHADLAQRSSPVRASCTWSRSSRNAPRNRRRQRSTC